MTSKQFHKWFHISMALLLIICVAVALNREPEMKSNFKPNFNNDPATIHELDSIRKYGH